MSETPRLLGGRYEVGQLLGRGGMAEVHIGRDTRLGRSVAIKMLRADLARDPQFHKRFRREAQAAASLNHPSIVAVYDSGEDVIEEAGGATVQAPYIVMEYVEGRTVRDVLTQAGSLDWQESLRITSGVLAALEYSHRTGIVHRDIKPANVMLTPTGAVKVMDFGIARALADSSATMTQTQAVIGTAQYLSPEQAKGQSVDARSDIYSTGCLLFELLTGRPPFIGDSPVAVAYQHVGEMPPAPSSLVHSGPLPPEVDAIDLHALAKDRETRYQSAAAMRADCEALLAGRPISAAAAGALGVPAGPVPGLGLEAAGAAAALAADAYPGATLPTEAIPAATEAFPLGLGPSYPAAGYSDPPATGSILPPHEEDEFGGPRKPNRAPAFVLLGLAAIAALVLLLIFAPKLFGGGPDVKNVEVPPVANTTQAQAVAALTKAGLKNTVVTAADDTVKKGYVVSATPTSGTSVKVGSVVTITVSTGPNSVAVPDVSGLSQDDATAKLTKAGLSVGTVDTVTSALRAKGQVLQTTPAAGEVVDKSTPINLQLASGQDIVPNVVGQPATSAVNTLSALGFKVHQVFAPSDQPQGNVTGQDHAGDSLGHGKTVNITISNGQPSSTPTDTSTATATSTGTATATP